MNVLVIGNPIAGGGRAARKIAELGELLRGNGHAVETFLTSGAGDARTRAAALGRGVDVVVAAGGDGTLNEVLNGLHAPVTARVAFLPAGTANVTARELGLAGTCAETLRLIEEGAVRRLDIGTAGGRRFLMLASVGFDALVCAEDKKYRTGAQGVLRLVVPVFRALRHYRAPALSVSVDGAPPLDGAMVIVSKTAHYGGYFTVARDARCDSGTFEVTVFERGSRRALLCYAIGALRGTLDTRADVLRLRGTRVEVRSKAPAWVELDGDFAGMTPLVAELVPGFMPFAARER